MKSKKENESFTMTETGSTFKVVSELPNDRVTLFYSLDRTNKRVSILSTHSDGKFMFKDCSSIDHDLHLLRTMIKLFEHAYEVFTGKKPENPIQVSMPIHMAEPSQKLHDDISLAVRHASSDPIKDVNPFVILQELHNKGYRLMEVEN